MSTNDHSAPTNRLAREPSPYLRQHAHNPVDWYPWGEEAFARARAENRPVFLSIGYSTCHWCHVMERESFEQISVAEFLNRHFVSIKVDREERPDVDRIYLNFVQATTGGGGWPLNVFLTPDLKPFFGGTYFPPDTRPGRPGFLPLLQQISGLWLERNEEIVASAGELHARLEAAAARAGGEPPALTPEVLRHALEVFKAAYDPVNGGFGGAPKFPQPSIPSFLLRAARRFGDGAARDMVLRTCERMAAGGLHDQLEGGFARYAVDAGWRVPHFEKMLYDNAQLTQLYLDAYLVSGDERHAVVARGIVDYVLRDLTDPAGGFYSAEDADSEGHEGKFYCWTRAELSRLLTVEEFNAAAGFYGITEAGNFVDHSHPQPLAGLNVLSRMDADPPAADRPLLEAARVKMRNARRLRVRPLRDDKILTSWNGLMLGACARAAVVLKDAAYRAAAEKNLAFLRGHLWEPSSRTLGHRWREGVRDDVQLLEDYAFLLSGVLAAYQATLNAQHLEFAIELAGAMLGKFFDPADGGFWQSAADTRHLILRLKDDYDGAEPSGNAVAALALLQLAALTGREDFRAPAEATLRHFAPRLRSQPSALAFMLHALDFQLEPPLRVVIAGAPGGAPFDAMLHAAHAVYQPRAVISGNQGAVEAFAQTLPAGNRATAYLCTGGACQPPTDDAARLKELLAGSR